MPLIFFLVCCFIIVVPFSILVVFLVMKGKKQAWTGTITDKVYNEKDSDDHPGRKESFYSLNIKTDDGKEIKLGVDRIKYNEYKVGDRLKKESGKLWPVKIS